jgi:hypothetical protein
MVHAHVLDSVTLSPIGKVICVRRLRYIERMKLLHL